MYLSTQQLIVPITTLSYALIFTEPRSQQIESQFNLSHWLQWTVRPLRSLIFTHWHGWQAAGLSLLFGKNLKIKSFIYKMLFEMDENVINSQSFLSQFEMALNLTFDRVARCSTFTRRRSALAHELFVYYSTYIRGKDYIHFYIETFQNNVLNWPPMGEQYRGLCRTNSGRSSAPTILLISLCDPLCNVFWWNEHQTNVCSLHFSFYTEPTAALLVVVHQCSLQWTESTRCHSREGD